MSASDSGCIIDKMELLEENANVRIRLIPAVGGDAYAFLKRVAATLTHPDNADGFAGADLYMCLQNSEATVTKNIVNFSNLIRIFPDNQINLRKTFTTTFEPDALADQIVDDSQSQAVKKLLSAIFVVGLRAVTRLRLDVPTIYLLPPVHSGK